MSFTRRKLLHLVAGVLALPALPRIACAQSFPTRPITMIVPYPAGGPTDTIARLLAERMRASLGQPVIIENVAGAGGNIGVGRVARAAGRWLHAEHRALGLACRQRRDLHAAVRPADRSRAGRADRGRSAADRRREVRAGEGHQGTDRVAQGQSRQGHGRNDRRRRRVASRGHPVCRTPPAPDIQIVPYRGAAPRMQDMLSGQIHLAFDQASSALPQVRGGNLQAYAVTSKTRLAVAPDIPTVDEAGLPGFYMSVWHGLWASKGTPKDVVRKLNAAARRRARRSDRARSGSPSSGRSCRRASSRRRRRWAPIRRPRSTSGGRSSRRPASRWIDQRVSRQSGHARIRTARLPAPFPPACPESVLTRRGPVPALALPATRWRRGSETWRVVPSGADASWSRR